MDLLINVDNAFLKVFHGTVFHNLTDECPDYEEVDQYSAKLYEWINKLGLIITLAVLWDKFKLEWRQIELIFVICIGSVFCEKILAWEVKGVRAQGLSVCIDNLGQHFMHFMSHIPIKAFTKCQNIVIEFSAWLNWMQFKGTIFVVDCLLVLPHSSYKSVI